MLFWNATDHGNIGGAISNLLAFKTSNIKNLLDKGPLKPGLCIFGDNNYVNQSYMATPFPGVKGDKKKDAHNFFFFFSTTEN